MGIRFVNSDNTPIFLPPNRKKNWLRNLIPTTGAGLHDRRRTRGHAALRGEGHSWTVAKSTQRPLPRPSSFIIAEINKYQIFLVYLSYHAPYRSVLINSVIVCLLYLHVSNKAQSLYSWNNYLNLPIFSIVLRQGPPPHLHLNLCNKHNKLRQPCFWNS